MKLLQVLLIAVVALTNASVALHDSLELAAGKPLPVYTDNSHQHNSDRSFGHDSFNHHCCHFHHTHFYVNPGLSLLPGDSDASNWMMSAAPRLQLVGNNPPVPPPKA